MEYTTNENTNLCLFWINNLYIIIPNYLFQYSLTVFFLQKLYIALYSGLDIYIKLATLKLIFYWPKHSKMVITKYPNCNIILKMLLFVFVTVQILNSWPCYQMLHLASVNPFVMFNPVADIFNLTFTWVYNANIVAT